MSLSLLETFDHERYMEEETNSLSELTLGELIERFGWLLPAELLSKVSWIYVNREKVADMPNY